MKNLARIIFDSLLVLMLLGLLVLPISSVGLLGINGTVGLYSNNDVLSAQSTRTERVTNTPIKRILKINSAVKETTQATKSTNTNKR